MKTFVVISLLASLITACSAVSDAENPAIQPSHELGWMVGCWESESGQSREVWTQEADLLLGYSIDIKDGKVGFFEQMRIAKTENGYDFIVSPFGGAWVTFSQSALEGETISFVNPDNDYPNVIKYLRSGHKLDAEISALDGGNPTPFNKTACKTS